ncbi:MAG: glycosyltransferase family 4 protein [Nitrospiria bacterium]
MNLTSLVMTALALLGAFLASCGLTSVVRRYALGRSIVDRPNSRSSHTVPMPRGGGAAIAVSWGLALGAMVISGALDMWVGLALLMGGGAVASIGWLDDRRGLPAGVRGGIHLAAAAWAVWCLGGLPFLNVGLTVAPLGWMGSVLAVFGIAWLTNLYNFMDGIDGLAAGEALSVGLIAGGLLMAAGADGLALAALTLAAASAGFLVFNWPPAKIFMGDVGSGLLGYAFGVLALASERAGAVPLMVWAILLGVFLVDATATLIRRVVAGERWYEAHRSHAYQRAVQAGYSHREVTLAVLGVNVLLALFAVGGWAAPRFLPAIVGLTVGLLTVVWYRVCRAVVLEPVRMD